ncbi:PPC domain-containing protein [Dolichospermum sp. ST_sed10]|nr:PPC domain-containing protein [Dolichospermum sp. ST_sed10]
MNNSFPYSINSIHDGIARFADLDTFWNSFDNIFGSEYNQSIAQTLRSEWQNRDFSQLPEIEVINSDILGNANGAYASSTNKIYLADSFLANATLEAINAVLLEEIGHFVDAHVKSQDTPGDEGELFSAIVRGVNLSSSDLARIHNENDQKLITIDGTTLSIEQSSIGIGFVEGYRSWYDYFSYCASSDTWSFQIGATGTSSDYINVYNYSSLVDIVLTLGDEFGNYITSADTGFSGEGETLYLTGLAPGYYTAVVSDYYDGISLYDEYYGEYYDEYYGEYYDAAYELNINAPYYIPAGIIPDSYESNNEQSTATSLGSVSQYLSDLNIDSGSDEDWFKITLLTDGTSSNYVETDFTGSLGDLDLALYQEDGTYITDSATTGDQELISLDGLAAGDYFIQVYGYSGAINTYSLETDLPTVTITGDQFEPNNTQLTAKDFGLISGISQWDNLSIGSSDQDWFKFRLGSTGGEGNFLQIAFTHSLGDVDMRLYNASGVEVASSAGVIDEEQISLQGFAAGDYFVKVYGYSSATNPNYSLTQ